MYLFWRVNLPDAIAPRPEFVGERNVEKGSASVGLTVLAHIVSDSSRDLIQFGVHTCVASAPAPTSTMAAPTTTTLMQDCRTPVRRSDVVTRNWPNPSSIVDGAAHLGPDNDNRFVGISFRLPRRPSLYLCVSLSLLLSHKRTNSRRNGSSSQRL